MLCGLVECLCSVLEEGCGLVLVVVCGVVLV